MIIPASSRGRIPAEVLAATGRPCNLRGGILKARLAWIEARREPDALERVLGSLPPPLRSFEPGSVRADGWVPFGTLVSFDKAIARVFAPGREEETYVALGRTSAERTFGGVAARSSSVHHHFWTGKLDHTEFGDFGTCTYVPLEAHALRMEYREYPVKSRVFCLSAHGFFERSVELLGGREPIVEETTCQCYGDEACVYRVSWEE